MTKYKAYIGVIDTKDKIEKVCEDIKARDSTFKYKINDSFGKLKQKFKFILVIFDETEEGVSKRAGWLIHKMKDAKVADYFWVKECKKRKEV